MSICSSTKQTRPDKCARTLWTARKTFTRRCNSSERCRTPTIRTSASPPGPSAPPFAASAPPPPFAPGFVAPQAPPPPQIVVVQQEPHKWYQWDPVKGTGPSFKEVCRKSEQDSTLTKGHRMACRLIAWLSILFSVIAGVVIIVVGTVTNTNILFTVGGVILGFSCVAFLGMACVSCWGLFWCCSCG